MTKMVKGAVYKVSVCSTKIDSKERDETEGNRRGYEVEEV